MSAAEGTYRDGCELSFIWGFTEDYSPGVSLSDSSEELCQRGEGEASIYRILAKGYIQIKHNLGRRLLLVTRN